MKKCIILILLSLFGIIAKGQSIFNSSYRDGRLYDVTEYVLGHNNKFSLTEYLLASPFKAYDYDKNPGLFSINGSTITIKHPDWTQIYTRGKLSQQTMITSNGDIRVNMYECQSNKGDTCYFRAMYETNNLTIHQYVINYDSGKVVQLGVYFLKE